MAIEDFEKFKSDEFMEIVDVGLFENTYLNYPQGETMRSGLILKVIQDSGVEVTPNFEIKTTELHGGYKNYKSNGDDTITFKVDVIIDSKATWVYQDKSKKTYNFDGEKSVYLGGLVTKWLDYWMQHLRPLYVVTDAIDIPNGTYLLTSNSERKQTYRKYTIWTLEFTTYKKLRIHHFKDDNTLVQQAIDALINPPKQEVATAQTQNTLNIALLTCSNEGNIVFSKTKNYTDCNVFLQEKLYQLGYLQKQANAVAGWIGDGWYGSETMEAVKKFQRAWNSKGGNLLVDGIAGPVTISKLVTW